MHKLKITLLLLFLILSISYGKDIDIPKEIRIPNDPSGSCYWCSLEMIGRKQKVEELYNIKENQKKMPWTYTWNGYGWQTMSPCNAIPDYAKERLNTLEVEYEMLPIGSKDTSWLTKNLEKDKSIAVAVHLKQGLHVELLIGLDNKEARLIDPNDINNTTTWSREDFMNKWDGWSTIIIGSKIKKVVVK